MPVRRSFLGCDRPALHAAADYLVDRHRLANTVDLGRVVVVLPGGRAARRLRELLIEQCQERSFLLFPPDMITPGALPERLYEARRPFAPELVQQLAWAAALRAVPASDLAAVIPHPPAEIDSPAWLELGRLLWRQHRELAADRMDFADVARLGAEVDGFAESQRWNALAGVQRRYLEILNRLDLWDRQTARLLAIDQHECRTDAEIVLVGMVDMNRTLRDMLDQAAAAGRDESNDKDRIVALVFAPPAWADRFDEHGCVHAAAWEAADIELDDDAIVAADDPADQAEAVARAIAAWEGRYRADEITIGVPDERIVPQIQRQLEECGVSSRWVVGRKLPQTGPYRLLEAVADYLEHRRYSDFASLVRHPDMMHWLQRHGARGDLLTAIDDYSNEHLPARLGNEWLGDARRAELLRVAHRAIESLLEPLEESGAGRRRGASNANAPARPLGEWSQPLVDFLLKVYGQRQLHPDRPEDRFLQGSCELLIDSLVGNDLSALESASAAEPRGERDEFAAGLIAVPADLAPQTTAAHAIRLALDQARGETIPTPVAADAVELLGWLELVLDDAPALVVTSVNEQIVPSSLNADLFLPNRLRSVLKLEDNARRYARDAYALSVLAVSRKELALVFGRRDADGTPLFPSRLLFATDRRSILRRALAYFREMPRNSVKLPLARTWPKPRVEADFPIPRPIAPAEPLSRLRVTDFSAYLACPYRFYLGRIMGLGALTDSAEELDGAAFGTLLHEVLAEFAGGPLRNSTDAGKIAAYLSAALDAVARHRYGRDSLAAIRVQIEQARLRLATFAETQAAWVAKGWRIEHAEVPAGIGEVEWVVDGSPILLRGRIDRIDVHQPTGERAILDYKTSDSAMTPEQTHRVRGEWVDLQLPLYRHLARALEITEPVRLGYVLLPKRASRTEFCLADWSPEELLEADALAEEVVRSIRRGAFWPPVDPPPKFAEEFAPICQDLVFGRAAGSTDMGAMQ
jgi:ATP-dependent helicase/nuclease subunit B